MERTYGRYKLQATSTSADASAVVHQGETFREENGKKKVGITWWQAKAKDLGA